MAQGSPQSPPDETDLGVYVLVSPVRNEEKYLKCTIDSVTGQTHVPAEWIVVDDGSSDHTWDILEDAAREFPWIIPTRRSDRGFRYSGVGVVEAFYDGFERISRSDWEFLVKLDGDLFFSNTYFADCLSRFREDPELGIGGGMVCDLVGGELVPESKHDPKFHVRGATKIYRRACWDAIGGLLRSPGWDGMDEIHANMLGWRTMTFPDIKLRHCRPSGLATGLWKDWVKGGKGNYAAGYHPFFLVAKCLRRLVSKPYGLASLGLLVGYFGSLLKGEPRVADPRAIKYIRQQQINRLLGRRSIWKGDY